MVAHDIDEAIDLSDGIVVMTNRSAATIGERVNLSGAAVRKRLARLERSGVITGYTVALNHDLIGSSVE